MPDVVQAELLCASFPWLSNRKGNNQCFPHSCITKIKLSKAISMSGTYDKCM
jgi:hypothetical protein